jgi:hypothetical protein
MGQAIPRSARDVATKSSSLSRLLLRIPIALRWRSTYHNSRGNAENSTGPPERIKRRRGTDPDYSAGKPRKVCSFVQPSDMVKEMVCSCRVGVSFDPTLPCSVRVTSAVEKWLTESSVARYAQEQDKRVFFCNVTTGLPASGCVGHPTETFLGSAGRPFCPSRAPKRSKLQGRRIFLVYITCY